MSKKRNLTKKLIAIALSATVLAGTSFTTVGQFIGTSGISVSAGSTGRSISGGYFGTFGDFDCAVFDSGVVYINEYIGEGGDVTVPSEIDGKSVTKIDNGAFENCTGLTSITIPDSVTEIDGYAFRGCTGLTSINIPDSVAEIGMEAFSDCTGLTSITIPDSVTSISDYAFYGCKGLTSITIPDSVTSIGYSAFRRCTGLTSITIPDSVTSIDGAFSDCTGLTSINVSKNNSTYSSSNGVLFNKDKTKIICYPAGKKGKYSIPDSVTEIGSSAFEDCTSLTSITIPDGVTSIGSSAFYGCTGLTSITIPDGVTEIDYYAFYGCTSLTSITIPDSLTSMGSSAFSGCTELTSVTIGNGVTSIGESAFENCTGLTSVTIGNSVTTIRWSAFENCTGLTSITIPDSVTSIYSSVFSGCIGLTSINIPDGVTEIDYYTFYGCTGLTSITIPDSVTSIDRGAFENCTGLTIYGVKGSYAETYANENDIPFVSVNGYTNLSTISADKITLGKTVTVNAKAILGKGDYTYAVLYKKKADTKWTVKQNYSTNDTITIKPAKATDYDVCVKVKDSTGKIVKKFFEVKVNAKLKNTSTISATTIKKGETVTLSGSATGGTGNYTYAALYKKKSETKWTVRQGYKANSEILVRPYTNTDYDICVKIQDEEGTIAKKYFTVTVTK